MWNSHRDRPEIPEPVLCRLYLCMGLQLRVFWFFKITMIHVRMYCSLSMKINMHEMLFSA